MLFKMLISIVNHTYQLLVGSRLFRELLSADCFRTASCYDFEETQIQGYANGSILPGLDSRSNIEKTEKENKIRA